MSITHEVAEENGTTSALAELAGGKVKVELAPTTKPMHDDPQTEKVLRNYQEYVKTFDEIDLLEAAGIDTSKLSKSLNRSETEEYAARIAHRFLALAYQEVNQKLDGSELKVAEAILLVRRALQDALEKLKP